MNYGINVIPNLVKIQLKPLGKKKNMIENYLLTAVDKKSVNERKSFIICICALLKIKKRCNSLDKNVKK